MSQTPIASAVMESTEIDDQRLLRRFRRGDLEALEALHRRHRRALYVFALSLSRSPVAAEDLVQEAYLRLLERDASDPPRRVRSFLFTVVRNAATDELRRRRRSLESHRWVALSRARPGVPRRFSEATAQAISGALADLPDEQREVVMLKVYGDLGLAEIAELLDVPMGTVASRYRYGIEKLGGVLRKELEP